MARYRVPHSYPTGLAIGRGIILTIEFAILLACVALIARWPAILNDVVTCLSLAAWASVLDVAEIIGLLNSRRSCPRVSHGCMVCLDLLTMLGCVIATPLVWLSFHFSEACDPDECQPRRKIEDYVLPGIDMVPIGLAVVVGILHCGMMCVGCSINCMTPRKKARVYIMTEEQIEAQSVTSRYLNRTTVPAPAPAYVLTEVDAATETQAETETAPAYTETEEVPVPVPAYVPSTSNIKTGPYAEPQP